MYNTVRIKAAEAAEIETAGIYPVFKNTNTGVFRIYPEDEQYVTVTGTAETISAFENTITLAEYGVGPIVKGQKMYPRP